MTSKIVLKVVLRYRKQDAKKKYVYNVILELEEPLGYFRTLCHNADCMHSPNIESLFCVNDGK